MRGRIIPVISLRLVFDFHRTGAVGVTGYDLVALVVLARNIVDRKGLDFLRSRIVNLDGLNVVPQIHLG